MWPFAGEYAFSNDGSGHSANVLAQSSPLVRYCQQVCMTATLFPRAVQAIVTGDDVGLRSLLLQEPSLVHARATSEPRPTLLHYVAANGVEPQRSPKNAPAIARILLEGGADVDAVAPIYEEPFSNTTLCLTVTSCHPYLAGVQASLVDVLVDHGAKVDGLADDGAPLGCALLFGYREAAERLVLRGARVDNLIFASGLGRTDVVRHMLVSGTGTERIVRRTDGQAGRLHRQWDRLAVPVRCDPLPGAGSRRLLSSAQAVATRVSSSAGGVVRTPAP